MIGCDVHNGCAAKAALEKKQKEDGTYRQEEYTPPVSSMGLECSMDGCVDLTKKFMENLLLLISLAKETFAYLLPDGLNLSMQLLWDGTMGLSSWIGFALASLYYVGTDYGFGETMCEIYGYGYYVIDGMNYIVAFAKPAASEEESTDEASDEDKAAAAASAQASFNDSKEESEGGDAVEGDASVEAEAGDEPAVEGEAEVEGDAAEGEVEGDAEVPAPADAEE